MQVQWTLLAGPAAGFAFCHLGKALSWSWSSGSYDSAGQNGSHSASQFTAGASVSRKVMTAGTEMQLYDCPVSWKASDVVDVD